MESNYHIPDAFRFSLNSFIRSIKEIPQILTMELQGENDYRQAIKPQLDQLNANAFFGKLSKHRNFLVHRGMLDILSKGQVGTTEGRGVKIAIGFNIGPHESSDEAYDRYLAACKSDKTFRNLTGPDCDSSPCIWREWRIQDFPDTELLELAISAWRLIGETISTIVVSLGGENLDLTFSCRHDPEAVKMKMFSQRDFFRTVDGIEVS